MKRKVLGIILVSSIMATMFAGCQSVTKSFGGSMTINLEPNTKLELITELSVKSPLF